MSTSAINMNNVFAASQSANSNSTVKKPDTGENAFLKLLVEQLKHQDPLAPQDGAQFVAQLAQFNSLEQLISINERLGEVLGKTEPAGK
jgi:flagellar basal-body rod modification protein FlgD